MNKCLLGIIFLGNFIFANNEHYVLKEAKDCSHCKEGESG